MDWKWTVSFLFFAVFGSLCHQAPASTRTYELGTSYSYEYVTEVLLNEVTGQQPASTVGYQVSADVQVTPVWQNEAEKLMQIKLVSPKLHIRSRKAPSPEGFLSHSSRLDSSENDPVYVIWNSGRVSGLLVSKGESESLLNLKRGVAGIFQFQDRSSEVEESGVTGVCRVTYRTNDGRHVTKEVNQCQNAEQLVSYTHNNPVLGSSVESTYKSEYSLSREESVIAKAEVEETHVVRVSMKKDSGNLVSSRQSIKLTGTSTSKEKLQASTLTAAVQELSKKYKVELVQVTLESSPETHTCTENCKNFANLVEELKDVLLAKHMATVKMASAHAKLVQKLRTTPKSAIVEVLKSKKYKKQLPQILDAIATAQTVDSHNAVKEILDFKKAENIELPERYLLALSLASHPPEEVVRDLMEISKKKISNQKLKETLVLTLGAFAKTLSRNSPKLVDEIKNHLLTSLEKCKTEPCKHMYLRGLKNLGTPDIIPTLLEHIRKGERKVAVTAVKALTSVPPEAIDDQVKSVLNQVYHQLTRRYDSSARTLSVDILLRSSPSRDTILNIMRAFNTGDNAEVQTYAWQRMLEFSEVDCRLRGFIEEGLKDRSINNYDSLARGGMSTAFSRLFAVTPSGNSTFSSSTEVEALMLKRSSFDVYLQDPQSNLHFLQYAVFAGGLNSFGGGSSELEVEEEEAEDTTAGMELSLMGVQMRPYVFFNGNSELMGHVWSGTASERTTALQGNILMQDTSQRIPLQNGITVDCNVMGSLSYDVAGQIQISLWNRNAHSLVENSGALVLQSVMSLDTSFVRSQVESNLAAEATLHFVSDIDFYSDIVICLQLSQPEFSIRHNIHKIERIPGSKHRLRKSKYKSQVVPGKTYAFNSKNSEMCTNMFSESE